MWTTLIRKLIENRSGPDLGLLLFFSCIIPREKFIIHDSCHIQSDDIYVLYEVRIPFIIKIKK